MTEISGAWRIPVGGKQPRGFTWHGDDLPTGTVISSATKSVSPATGLTVDDPIVNTAQDGVNFWITAVTAGVYLITITATRSDGAKNVEVASVRVGDPDVSATALVTLDEARSFMGWKSGEFPENDARLGIIIDAVSALFASEADPDFKSATYTAEKHDGNGKSYLYLDHYPVTTFTSLTLDGTTLTQDTEFFVDMDEGILECGYTGWPGIMYPAKWTSQRQGIVVTYIAGYAAVPADVKMACLVEVARAWNTVNAQMFGESGRTQEGLTINVNTDELLPATLATLGRYTRVRI